MTGASGRRGRWRWPLLGALLAVAALAALWAWQARPLEAEVLVLEARPLQRSLQFSARVQSPARVELGSTLTGRVRDVQVREGDAVAAGAALLMLEADELGAALQQARATLHQAEARVASQRDVSRAGAEAALRQAQAARVAAEREFLRTQDLLAAQFVSAARLDDARQALDSARAQQDAAAAQARANAGGGSEVVAARAQQAVAQAAVEAAQARLAQATLRAPAAGRILLREVEPGQIVQPGRALLTLARDGPTELIANVDERFLGQLQPGQSARVVADAFPGRAFDARLQRLAPAVDAQRGAVEVVFGVDPVPDFLREDMTLSVEVVTGERKSALVLPLRALRGNAVGIVGVVEQGRVVERPLNLGLRTLDQAEVLSGLSAGDQVLLDPSIPPGTRVRARAVSALQALPKAGPAAGAEGIGNAMSGGAVR